MHLNIGIITNLESELKEYESYLKEKDCSFFFRSGELLEDAIAITKALQAEHNIDAVITMKATSRILVDHVDIPVIPLQLKSYDVLKALWEICRVGKNPAFVEINSYDLQYDFEEIIQLLGYEVKLYKFTGFDNLPALTDQIINDGCDVVASVGTRTIAALKSQGINTLLFSPGIQAFTDALEKVKHIFVDRAKEAQKTKWLNAMVNNANVGILAWDDAGIIMQCNNDAKIIIGAAQDVVIGQALEDLKEVFPWLAEIENLSDGFQVVKSAGEEYVASKQDIIDNGTYLGSIMRIKPLGSIQQIEMQSRRIKSETGFVATKHFSDIHGASSKIDMVKNRAIKYANYNSNVLIMGESGSGKEMFAQSIHNYSDFWQGPFVAINCSALTDTLLESELFGYEKGSFTGANKSGKPGLLELAHNGTFFMDEIGEIPLNLQVKLLRVLQERTVRRIGGDRNIPLRVRFIFATNRNLVSQMQSGSFRSDLYYRINVLPLKLPPLRERKEDIPIILNSIIKEISTRTGLMYDFPLNCQSILAQYDWPGNVRELYNFVERLIILGLQREEEIAALLRELQEEQRQLKMPDMLLETESLIVPVGPMREMEDAIINALLDKYGGNKKRVEKVLHLSSTTLWRRFKQLK